MTDFSPLEAPATDINHLPVMHPGRPAGRDEELKEIYNHLRANQAILIHGAPGIGKTTLAAALAAAYVQQPGGVLWLTTTPETTLTSLYVRVGRAYGVHELTRSDNPTALTGTVTATLLQHKPLIILDGGLPTTAAAEFVQKCADNLPVMLLAEESSDGPWAILALDRLDDMAAVILFKQKAGISDNDADVNIYGIAKMVDYRPFPLVVAARAMAASKQSPEEYSNALKQVLELSGGDGTIAALTASYRALNNALQGLLLMLGATFRGEASAELTSMISGAPMESINQAVTVLSQLYLLEKFERGGAPYYRMHPIVHRFAQTWLRGSNRLESLQERVRDAVVEYARRYSAPGSISHQKLAIEMDNFLAAARWSAAHGDQDTANKLVVALTQADDFINERGYVYELLQLRGASSGSTSAFPAYGPEVPITAEYPDDDEAFDDYDDEDNFDDYADDEDFEDEVSAYDDDDFEDDDEYDDAGVAMASAPPPGFDDDYHPPEATPSMTARTLFDALPEDAYMDDDDDDAAYEEAVHYESTANIDIDQLRTALTQARQQRDVPRQVQILNAIGKVQMNQGRDEEAIATYNEALTACESLGDDDGTLETLITLASLLARTGNSSAAVMHAMRGIELAENRDDDDALMRLLISLGDARQDMGESDAAVEAFSRALTLARDVEDDINEALTLYRLGYAHLDNGDTGTAISTLEEARELFRTQNQRGYEGRVLGGLGAAYSELGRWSEAIRYYKSALHIAREVRDREEEALQLSNLGQAQKEGDQLKDALLSYRQALHLAYESGQRANIVSAIVDLVELMQRSNRLLAICMLLIEDALRLEPNDRTVLSLQETILARLQEAEARGIQQSPVAGTAQQYAANAYALLEA